MKKFALITLVLCLHILNCLIMYEGGWKAGFDAASAGAWGDAIPPKGF